MADYEKLAGQVEKLSLPEVAEFVKFLEERWGVSAAAPMMMGAMPGGAGAEAAEEKTAFDVVLEDIGPEKIKVIKAVREVNGSLGLKEAKEVVESAPAPILQGIGKDDAEAAQKTLEGAGAKASIK
ncbi:MAG: 50S ribosomal protein L7/L12 [Anaerolineae bacterium]